MPRDFGYSLELNSGCKVEFGSQRSTRLLYSRRHILTETHREIQFEKLQSSVSPILLRKESYFSIERNPMYKKE